MTNNEIDDIFSSAAGESGKTSSNKKKGKTGKSESSDPIGNVKEKKTQSEKKKISAPQSNTAGKRKVAETVIDPSKMVERAASTSAKKQKKGKSSTTKGISNEDEEFRDSRGTIRRKTEDGFSIYSEKELKLDQGGDTPLCPFDCDCCF